MSRPVPVMLIHGFAGTPAAWIESGFKARLVGTFGLDPDLIHIFHYGLDPHGHYDNRGDIRRIAARLTERDATRPEDLESQVARLSQKSVTRGGPEAVTLVGFSMGGLVARYWMSRRRPDEFGTRFDAPVARLIMIATPHLGVDLLDLPRRLVAPDEFIVKLADGIERLPFVQGRPGTALRRVEARIEAVQRYALQQYYPEVAATGSLDSPALRQMHPASTFLRRLNRRGTWPANVDGVLFWGDIRFGATLRAGPLLLWERLATFGDLLISARSASEVPGVEATTFPLMHETRWDFDVLTPYRDVGPREVSDLLPEEYHGNLLKSSLVQSEIGRLLTASVADRYDSDTD